MVGLIDKAQRAKEETEIAQEKEQLQFAIAGLKLADKEINVENLQKELNNSSENTDVKVEKLGENDFLVTFPSGRVYEVEDGNIEYVGEKGKLEDIIIKVNKEQDLEEKQIQEVEVTIKTYNNREENKTVKLEYAWNKDKGIKPSSYRQAQLEENNITRKATISSEEQETGYYYLWIKVTVNGKTVEKTYGEYYIKKYTTLVKATFGSGADKGFLGNNEIQKGKIKTITLQNTLEGKNTDESKCWDVSEAQNEEIIAWYEENQIGDNTYYDVTIGAEGKIRANADSSDLFAYIGANVTNEEVKIEGLENLDTSNVTNMFHMFLGCSNLTSLNVSSFDTRNVTNMGSMFNGCRRLVSLDLNHFDTSNVTYMRQMFIDCNSLISLNLNNFNTSSVNDMEGMFQRCDSLKELSLSNFDVSNVKNMRSLLTGCKNLMVLDLRNWYLNDNVDINGMLNGSNDSIVIVISTNEIKDKLKKIYERFTDSNFQIVE